MAFREISDEEKAAVLAALVEGALSIAAISRKFHIPRSTILRWRSQYGMSPKVPADTSARIGELVAEHLTTGLDGLTRLVDQITNDQEWIKEQNASGIASLLNVLSDKVYRILETVENQPDEVEPNPDELG